MRTAYATALVFAALLSGCSKVMSTPGIKQNPHPKQRYEITMIIDGAPGPFDSVKASMGFHIANAADCVPQDPISGAHPTAPYDSPITLTRVNDHMYSGAIYLDFAQDEDYYGKGVCHWEFVAADVELQSHGVLFISGLSLESITSGKTVARYAPKRLYLGSKVPNMVVGAEDMSDDKAKHRDEYFSIALMAKKTSHE